MRRTRAALVVLVAPVALAGCSTLQADADAEAAVVADQVLPQVLDRALSRTDARAPEQRRATVERRLANPGDRAIEGRGGVTWVVQDATGTTVRVDVYLYLESGDLLPPDQGEAAWGVACRSYDVSGAVESTTVACPAGTPGTP